MKQKKRCKRRILFILTLALFVVEIRKDFIQKEQQKMAQMQNIFVDVSIKICIAQERRFFNFLGNTVSRFFAVEQPVSVVSWSVRSQSSRQRPLSKGKALLWFSVSNVYSWIDFKAGVGPTESSKKGLEQKDNVLKRIVFLLKWRAQRG